MNSSAHVQKFFFLAVLVVVVVLAKQGDVLNSPAKEAARTEALLGLQKNPHVASRVEPPLFILEPPRVETEERSGPEAEQARYGAGNREESEKIGPRNITQPVVLENISAAARRSGGAQGGDMSLPKVGAASAIVADLLADDSATGRRTYFESFADRRWPIASITKLVSAAVVSREINMLSEITLVESDFGPGSAENGLRVGATYTARDLMLAMLLMSSNEAAEALARTYDGGSTGLTASGRGAFISRMNTLAKGWELVNTNFDDPTGLSPANQSTVKDSVNMARHVYEEHPEIFEITRRKEAQITELKSGRVSTVANINLFAGWKEFIGGKTGYTDEAGGNLLTVFSGEKGPIVIVVLGSPDRFAETELLWNWFRPNFE